MGDEDRAELGSSAWLEQMKKKREELQEKKAHRPPTIHGHVSLDQADREERERRKVHPTTGSTREIPDRWSSHGTPPQQPERKDPRANQ